MATRLGVSEGTARVAVHRLRKRFREVYREEIAHTLPAGADADAEMRHLANALDIKEAKLHLQRRPYHWVEFYNVSLKPGRRTPLEVKDIGDATQSAASPHKNRGFSPSGEVGDAVGF